MKLFYGEQAIQFLMRFLMKVLWILDVVFRVLVRPAYNDRFVSQERGRG